MSSQRKYYLWAQSLALSYGSIANKIPAKKSKNLNYPPSVFKRTMLIELTIIQGIEKMKISILSSAIILCSFTAAAQAADDLPSFWDDSALNLKVRSALIKMDPNDVSLDTPFGPAVNSLLEAQVEQEGELNQSGSALWLHFESTYLYDVIGFDLGFQGAVKHAKEDQSSKLIIASQDDDGYSRLSSARVKLRYGNEELFAKGYYGRYSAADETDYLMDESDDGYGLSTHYQDFALSYDVVSASAGKTESDLQDRATDEQTISFAYSSDFGKANITREMTDDVLTNDSISVTSGIPLSFLGLPVATESMRDYLLIAQLDYATESQDALPSAELNQYEIMLATKLGGVTLAASYNQAGKDGGADVANIVDKALINAYDLPDQTTLSYALSIDGAMIRAPGLSVSVVYFDSKNIDMAAAPLIYQLTGDKSFSEVLVDTKYSFPEDSFLHGLMVRSIFGTETNQANVSGYGLYAEYNRSF
jgi:hypothetical protein